MALAAGAGALDLPKVHLDLLAGASGQANPPTEFSLPKLGCCPPAYSESRVSFYSDEYGFKPYGQRGGLNLRLLVDWELPFGQLKANHEFLLNWAQYALPKGQAWPRLPHRSRLLNFADNHSSTYDLVSETDHLYLKVQLSPKAELVVGRQPFNFSTNYYFIPNDLLSPFAPTDFLRLYKPGHDAGRLSFSLSELAQAELIALSGYSYDVFGEVLANERWAPDLALRKAGLLGRLHADTGELALGALAGWAATRNLIGLSMECDLGDGWMLGFEGNGSAWDDDPSRLWYDASLGLSGQFGPALTARMEFASSPSFPVCPFCAKLEREQRSLHALGLNWDSQGLWKLGLVNLSDLDRWEGLLSLNVQYSLGDESDLIVGARFPWRLPKERPFAATAFELAPLSASLSIRCFL